jgi:hypothetical protein
MTRILRLNDELKTLARQDCVGKMNLALPARGSTLMRPVYSGGRVNFSHSLATHGAGAIGRRAFGFNGNLRL